MKSGYLRFEPGVLFSGEIGAYGDQAFVTPTIHVRNSSASGLFWEGLGGITIHDQHIRAQGWAAVESAVVRWWGQGVAGALEEREAASSLSLGPRWGEVEMLWMWRPGVESIPSFHQGMGAMRFRLPGFLEVVQLGAGVGLDFVTSGLVTRSASVGYVHPSGCLDVGLNAWLDDDRGVPDLALNLTISPGRRAATPLRCSLADGVHDFLVCSNFRVLCGLWLTRLASTNDSLMTFRG